MFNAGCNYGMELCAARLSANIMVSYLASMYKTDVEVNETMD